MTKDEARLEVVQLFHAVICLFVFFVAQYFAGTVIAAVIAVALYFGLGWHRKKFSHGRQ